MVAREQPLTLELSTLQPIPDSQRHGTARDLFTVWFGSNLMLLTIVTGGLAVTVFALPLLWAIIGLTAGNLIGAVFMALHAAQGPRLGVPQMVQTRGQFGSVGSLLVVGIVIVMYLGFLASNLVLAGQAIASLNPHLTDTPGIVLVDAISVLAAIYGYDLIHGYTRAMTYVAGLVLALAFVWIIAVHGVPHDLWTRNTYHLSGLLGSISAAALWQIAYAPYVSDYSRYMPRVTGTVPAFWATYWGCSLGSLLPMLLGALVGLAAPQGNLVAGLGHLTSSIAPVVLTVFTLGVAAANAMNLYCGTLSTLTFGQTLMPSWSPGPRARALTTLVLFGLSLVAALYGKDSFLHYYEGFLDILLYVLVPWTSINLVDYYLLRHGDYDIPSFFQADGGLYGRVNIAAVTCYLLGILIQLPFMVSPLYTGFLAHRLGGVDVSWVIGLALTSPAYYLLARRSSMYCADRSFRAVVSGESPPVVRHGQEI